MLAARLLGPYVGFLAFRSPAPGCRDGRDAAITTFAGLRIDSDGHRSLSGTKRSARVEASSHLMPRSDLAEAIFYRRRSWPNIPIMSCRTQSDSVDPDPEGEEWPGECQRNRPSKPPETGGHIIGCCDETHSRLPPFTPFPSSSLRRPRPAPPFAKFRRGD